MSHRCHTPSLYQPTWAGSLWRCGDCRQRWIFNMPMQNFRVGEGYIRPAWEPISNWRYALTRVDPFFVILAVVFGIGTIVTLIQM